MKSIVAIIYCFALFSASGAEIAGTNDFRIYDGKLYNVNKSVLWGIPWTPLKEPNLFSYTYEYARLLRQTEKGWLVMINGEYSWRGDSRYYKKYVILEGNDSFNGRVSDDHVPNDRYIRTGEVVIDISDSLKAQTVPVYNFGLRNTPENRKLLKK